MLQIFPGLFSLLSFMKIWFFSLGNLNIAALLFLTRACIAPGSAGGNEAPLRASWFFMVTVAFTDCEHPFVAAVCSQYTTALFSVSFSASAPPSTTLMSQVSCWAPSQLQLERLQCCDHSSTFTVQCRVFQRVLFTVENAFYEKYSPTRTQLRRACNVASLNQPQAFYK